MKKILLILLAVTFFSLSANAGTVFLQDEFYFEADYGKEVSIPLATLLTDPDLVEVSFWKLDYPITFTINETEKVIVGTPSRTGNYTLELFVDTGEAADMTHIKIAVQPPTFNVAPIWFPNSSMRDSCLKQLQVFTLYTGSARDPNGDTLSFSLAQAPTWVRGFFLNKEQGKLQITGVPDKPREKYEIIVRASDGELFADYTIRGYTMYCRTTTTTDGLSTTTE